MKCARISLVTRTHAGQVPFAMRPGAALRALGSQRRRLQREQRRDVTRVCRAPPPVFGHMAESNNPKRKDGVWM